MNEEDQINEAVQHSRQEEKKNTKKPFQVFWQKVI